MERRVSLAKEFKPLMVFARAMGAAPYTFKNNIYKISPWAFFYTMILNILNLIFFLTETREPVNFYHNIKMAKLIHARGIFPLIAIILNTFYTLLRRRESNEFFRSVNKFDALINLRPGTKKHFVTIWAYMLSSIVIGFIYFLVDGIDATTRIGHGSMKLLIFMLNKFVMFGRTTASLSFFLAMLCSMLTRFQEIDRMIERDSKDLDASNMVLRKSVGMRKVWILYDQLMEATEKLNSMYSAELLIWILMSSLALLMRFHILRYQYQFKPIDRFTSGIVIGMVASRLLLLTWFCHRTAAMITNDGTEPIVRRKSNEPSKRESNFRSAWPPAFRSYLSSCTRPSISIRQRHATEVSAKAFRINSSVSQLNRSWDNEETFVIGQYFVVRRPLEITAGGGLLRINLPLLRTIIATVVTYLVILRSPSEERQGT